MLKRKYSLTRAALHGLTVFGILFAAAASASPAYAAPANDNIAGATKITPAAYSATIVDVATATTAATDPILSCEPAATQSQDSVWFWFTPANSGEVSINTLNSQYDTILAVFKNDPLVPGGLIELGCNDNASGTTSALVLPLRGGVRYFIEVVRKDGTAITATADMHINYAFATKVVAWGEPLGKKWDSNDDSLFVYSAGWSNYPVTAAYKGFIELSNNVNNKATTYFDGGTVDLYYALKPGSGTLDVYVDGNFEMGIGQHGAFTYPNFVVLGPYSDGVHKLELIHSVGGTTVNFDYIQVYSFPDVIDPGRILTLAASVSATTGKVTLKWKAVGDDGNVGTATSYELRYFVDPPVINCVADWGSGTPYTAGLPAPAVAGTAQQVTLSGLVPGFKYHFCLAAVDEVGNMGIPSNRVSATPTAGVPVGTGTYDDRHPAWTYTGNWKLVNNPDARYNTLHVSTKIDDTATISFTADQFVFTYMTSAAGGLMDVYIDGVYETTIDQYTFYPNSFYYTSPILAYGPHVVRFVHMTQIEVTVDQIYVWRSQDGGPPDPIVDLAAVPGAANGEVDLSWTTTGDDPGNAGAAKKYEIRYSTSPINNLVDWDYADPVGGVFPPPQAGGNVENVTVTGLTPGATYYFAVRSFDNAYYDVLSNTVSSLVAYTGLYATPPPQFYEDNDPIWEYSAMLPTWTPVNDATASAGHFRRINNAPAGSFARFWFTGTRFQLLFQANVGYGSLDVYVDGVKVGTIIQNNPVVLWKTYTSPIFAVGNHVVEFRVVGAKATIDRIKIVP